MFSHIYCYSLVWLPSKNIQEVLLVFPFLLILRDTVSPVCISLLMDRKRRDVHSTSRGTPYLTLGLIILQRHHSDRSIAQSGHPHCTNKTAPTSGGNQIPASSGPWRGFVCVCVCVAVWVCMCVCMWSIESLLCGSMGGVRYQTWVQRSVLPAGSLLYVRLVGFFLNNIRHLLVSLSNYCNLSHILNHLFTSIWWFLPQCVQCTVASLCVCASKQLQEITEAFYSKLPEMIHLCIISLLLSLVHFWFITRYVKR